MAKFKTPQPSSDASGPSAADLVGRLLAINPIKEDEFETRHGNRPGFRVHIHEIICDHGRLVDVEDLGETVLWQEVLIETCRAHDPVEDGYLVGRITRPNRAYLLKPPADDEIPAIETAIDLLDKLPGSTPQTEPAHAANPSPYTDEEPF